MSSSTTETVASLRAIIDSISNTSEQENQTRFWAGFTLKDVMYQTAHGESVETKTFSQLIDVLNNNSTPPYTGNEFSVGWQFKYRNAGVPKRTNPTASITPDEITQLIVKVVNGSLVSVREIPVWADLPFPSNSGTTVRINCDHHRLFRDYGRTYHNFLESESENLTLNQLEFYKPETQLVYFTRSQLLLMGAILNNSVSTSAAGQAKLLFSGYDQFVGRTGRQARMDNMTTFARQGITDPTNWFSLKAEIVPAEDFTDFAEPLAENSVNYPPQDSKDCCCEPPLPIPPITYCDQVAAASSRQSDSIQSSNSGGPAAPSAISGHPCPEPWYFNSAILTEANAMQRLTDPSRDACILMNAVI